MADGDADEHRDGINEADRVRCPDKGYGGTMTSSPDSMPMASSATTPSTS
jgi:hypothetical protein